MDNLQLDQASSNPQTTAGVDLSSCDREAVQFSAAIQPHGVLLVLEEPALFVSEVSANTLEILRVRAADLLGGTLAQALPAAQANWILRRINELNVAQLPRHLGRVAVADRRFEVFAHRSQNKLILELEMAPTKTVDAVALYAEVRSCIAELQAASAVRGLLDIAVRHIRSITGFDRVLAYKFLEDGSGHIQAEAKRDDLARFLGLHFPPGDVPAPARRIPSLVWIRDQPDTAYTPVPIEASRSDAAPLDLRYSGLRSTSAMCNRYYQNLGVRSKVVVALLNKGEMWGAVICQGARPMHVPLETRLACETIAHAVSLSLYEKERAAHSQQEVEVGARSRR